MSETFFPVNDLLRRKFQTSLIVISLTLCVASTLFLLLFGTRIGFGIAAMVEGKITASFSMVFSRFILFIGILSLIVGGVIVSFMAFMMMSQRIRDIGLMKAAGCPNDLIFGYFTTQLLIITFLGCFLGVVLGIFADLASTHLFSGFGMQVSRGPINLLFVLLFFALFFVLASVIGAKSILDTTKLEPAKAISPTCYFGLDKERGFKAISKSGFTIKIALRNLFRHKSATIRIMLCLTAVFVLVTVTVAGGIIADQTTRSWVEKAMGKDIVLIAHQETCNQYKLLLSKFYEEETSPQFNYTDEKYLISDELLNKLELTPSISIDARLVIEAHMREVPGYITDPNTGDPIPVGSNREGVSLIVGVEPEKVLNEWFVDGELLKTGQEWKAVIGDTTAQKMFSRPLNQSMLLFGGRFYIVGVCIDPINNGNVTYVPLKNLQNLTHTSKPNIIMAKIDPSANRAEILNQIRANVTAINSEFEVFELNEILDKNLGFVGYIWSTIMFLPLFSLVAASLCLVGYVMLAINEQRQEFGVLRAIGAKPKTVVKIISVQNLIVLLSCYAAGIVLGMIVTLFILVPEPLVTGYTVVEIATWLLIALAVTFIFSLYPAVKFAKKPILEIMT
jgi:ABC-type antimicrobial peptide transport system permease subunit